MRALRPPSTLGLRLAPIETTSWRVTARLVGFEREQGSDVQLVIADPVSGGTMIVQFPAASCVGKAAPAQAKAMMEQARQAVMRACGVPGDR